jgi:hypothetical protein
MGRNYRVRIITHKVVKNKHKMPEMKIVRNVLK